METFIYVQSQRKNLIDMPSNPKKTQTSMRMPLPDPSLLREVLNASFSCCPQAIEIVEGIGERWKKPRINTTIEATCHADIRMIQVKAFLQLLLLRKLATEYSVDPVVYIVALKDIVQGYGGGDVEARIEEAKALLRDVFYPGIEKFQIVEDAVRLSKDTASVLQILRYQDSLRHILTEIDTEKKLREADSIKGLTREIPITEYEKELLKIYLFDRGMLQTELAKYPFIGWAVVIEKDLNASYNIFDKSNAGAGILRKLICTDNDIECSGIIVLPDPIGVSGSSLRYQIQQRDVSRHETLLVSDPYEEIKRKICEQKGASLEFLNYVANNVIGPFISNAAKRELSSKYAYFMQKGLHDKLRSLVLEYYWNFIKRYQESISNVTHSYQSLFIQGERVEKALDALGSRRNREILKAIARSYKAEEIGPTLDQIYERLRNKDLGQGAKKGLYRNLRQLVQSGLVSVTQEGKLNVYYIYGKNSVVRTELPLLET